MQYSAKSNAFYADEFRADYEAAGTWPTDAIEVTPDLFAEFSGQAPAGKMRAAGANGLPVWVDDPAQTFTAIKPGILNQARAVREQLLNRLAGIGFGAMVAGDTATAQAVATARNGLLNITVDPGVEAATDEATLRAALKAAYLTIAAATPAAVQKAFGEVDL